MNDKVAIIFDANTLLKNIKDIEKLDCLTAETYDQCLNLIEINELHNINIFIPEVVFEEIIKNKKEKIIDRIKTLKTISHEFSEIEKFNILLLENFDVDKHMERLRKESKHINVIPLPNNKEELFNKIFKMSIEKIPPFQRGKSDKGFKDALIFLSLIDFANKSDYKDFIFFSMDKEAFVNNKNKLKKYFNKVTGKQLCIENTKDVSGYLLRKYGLYIEFRKYLDNEFYPNLYESIEEYRGLVDEKTKMYYNISEIIIDKDNSVLRQINPAEFELDVIFLVECRDINDRIIKISDLKRTYIFKKIEEGWKFEEGEFNYVVF